MYAIEFQNVGFYYSSTDENDVRRKNYVLEGLDFAVEKGAFVALLGRNGSGKSTLARLVNGLLKPTAGKVFVFGLDTAEKSNLFEIRKKAGMIFQNPDNQQIASIVEDDIAFGPENVAMPREKIAAAIDGALKATDMEKFRKSEVAKLSGGQKQRVAIAGAIAIEPEILIMDESTSMLDPKGRREVMEVARTLNKEKGMTVIDITHYMDEVIGADKVFVMDEGKVVLSGTPREVFSKVEHLKALRLDVPHTTELAFELEKAGIPMKRGILTIEEFTQELIKAAKGSVLRPDVV
mgnify:CR=1 FL=1